PHGYVVIGPFFATASFARMHARAECIARSGPHATGFPTRTASQNLATSKRVADGRSAPPPTLVADVDGALAGRLSEASSAGPPLFGVSSMLVALAASPLPSSKRRASRSCRRISVPFVPKNAS